MPDNKYPKPLQGDAQTVRHCLNVETTGKIWAIRPELLAPLADLDGHAVSEVVLERIKEAKVDRTGRSAKSGGVAVLGLKGMLTPTPSLLAMLFGGGGSGLLGFRSQLRAAAADPEISSIVLDVDSPGGYVDLIPEIAAEIRSARAEKPVVAVANTMMGSAAYWLGSQASEIVTSPSAEVGSIGVYQIHVDQSAALAQAGIQPTIIKAGKYKIEANPYQPLDSEAAASIQGDVNDYYNMFTADVAKGRSSATSAVTQADVKEGYGEGRMLMAKKAVKAGLADRIGTLDETVRRMSHPGALAALRKADAELDLIALQGVEDLEPIAGAEIEVEAVVATLSVEDKDRLLRVMLAG